MRMSGRSVAVLVPLALAAVAVPSIAVANGLGDDKFYGCADESGELYGAYVGTKPDCEAIEASWNADAAEYELPTVQLRQVEWNAKGVKGDKGDKGAAGTNLSGYKQTSKSLQISKGSAVQTVTCESGKVPVTGGGDSNSSSVSIRGSFPTANGWSVRFNSTSSSKKDVKVFVVCATAPAK